MAITPTTTIPLMDAAQKALDAAGTALCIYMSQSTNSALMPSTNAAIKSATDAVALLV